MATSPGWPTPSVASSGFPMHLWRINTSVDYSTFPSAAEFDPSNKAPTKRIGNSVPDEEGYTNAVWVDVDYACGQCHGGSFGFNATRNGAPYIDKPTLSRLAKDMHINQAPEVSFTSTMDANVATLTDTSTDDSPRFPDNAITVQWGDKTSATGNAGSVFTHTYAKAGKYKVVYSVKDMDGRVSSKTITLGPTFSITAQFSPATSSMADFTLLNNKGSIVATGKGTSSYVFSGLSAGTYKVKLEHSDCTFDASAKSKGNQNPMTVVIKNSNQTVNFNRTGP